MPIPIDRARAVLLGAAIGDALGWPFELPRRVAGEPVRRGGFFAWRRVVGARRWRFEEQLRAGSYSDDTQLVLATGRSLLRGDSWFRHLVEAELPTWTLYERGGGRQTKAAARSWAGGHAPWLAKRDEARRYFDGGGNGGAMRIAPHGIVGGEGWLQRVVADTAATHGHGRALVGATLHAWIIHACARNEASSEDLIRQALDAGETWGDPSLLDVLPDSWVQAHQDDPTAGWRLAVDETVELLKRAGTWRERGAVVADGEVLDDLGALGPSKGAGHVSAVSAAYIASRYGAQPMVGVESLARLTGADTDTLASMAASQLGAIVGSEPFAGLIEEVQDRDAIDGLASMLKAVVVGGTTTVEELHPAPKRELEKLKDVLWELPIGSSVRFPDGRSGELFDRRTYDSAESAEIVGHYMRFEDGQGVAVVTRRTRRGRPERPIDTKGPEPLTPAISPKPRIPSVGIRVALAIAGWEPLIELLTRCGVVVDLDKEGAVHIGDRVVLEPRGLEPQVQFGLDSTLVTVTIEVEDLGLVAEAAHDLGLELRDSPQGQILESLHPLNIAFAKVEGPD